MNTFLATNTLKQATLLRAVSSSTQVFPVTESSPLARKLAAFVTLSDADLSTLDQLHQRRRSFTAGVDLVHQGQADQSAYILAKGWVCSYKILPNGARQIVNFQIPGDFLGLAIGAVSHR